MSWRLSHNRYRVLTTAPTECDDSAINPNGFHQICRWKLCRGRWRASSLLYRLKVARAVVESLTEHFPSHEHRVQRVVYNFPAPLLT